MDVTVTTQEEQSDNAPATTENPSQDDTKQPEFVPTPLKLTVEHFSSPEPGTEVIERVKMILMQRQGVVNTPIEGDLRLPIHVACEASSLTMVKLLVGHGANVNAQDADGHTPMYFAALGEKLDILRYLCDGCNADITLERVSGTTPAISEYLGSLIRVDGRNRRPVDGVTIETILRESLDHKIARIQELKEMNAKTEAELHSCRGEILELKSFNARVRNELRELESRADVIEMTEKMSELEMRNSELKAERDKAVKQIAHARDIERQMEVMSEERAQLLEETEKQQKIASENEKRTQLELQTLRRQVHELLQKLQAQQEDTNSEEVEEVKESVPDVVLSTYSYAQLSDPAIWKSIPDIDRSKRECYLAIDEFVEVMGMSPLEFSQLAAFKQKRLKQQKKLW